MREGMFHSIADGRGWRCPNKECKKFTSPRSGSFFEGSNLALTDLVEFIYFWCEGLEGTQFLYKNFGRSPNTITDWKNFLRDLCVEKYPSNPEPNGGQGHVVEIDESKFG